MTIWVLAVTLSTPMTLYLLVGVDYTISSDVNGHASLAGLKGNHNTAGEGPDLLLLKKA